MTTFGALKADVRTWTNRDDLTDPVLASVLRLAEAEIARHVRVREQETRATLNATGATVALPADFLEAVSITRDNVSPTLKLVSTQVIRATSIRSLTGPPALVAIEGSNLVLAPQATVSDPVDILLTYFARFAALVNDTDSNWLTINAFDLVFYAMMKHTGFFLRDETMKAEYGGMFREALDELRASDVWSRYSGEPVEVSTYIPE